MRKLGLYLHIPFCVKKCNYCDFYSLCTLKGENLSSYIDALCSHIERESQAYREREIDTIFIGGGTPSLIECEDFIKLCDTIKKSLNVAENVEFSIEANPDTITQEKAQTWKECGVNRVSIGLQSALDEDLSVLGRVHDLKAFETGFSIVRERGFDNVNVDIMYALPSQTVAGLSKTLDYVAKLSPEHISAYCLKIEDSTPFAKMIDSLSIATDDEQYEMYLSIFEHLSSLGYEQYEISNFARQGKRCRHNMKYWLREEYIALGPSAHSFFDGKRYFYEPSVEKYTLPLVNGSVPEKLFEEEHTLSSDEKIDEYVMLRLRLCDGVCEDEFRKEFGKELSSLYDFEKYIKSGHIVKKGNSYSFTTKGFFVSNFILSDILKSI